MSDWSSDVCSSDLNQISLGDAGAHLSFLCEAGFGLHLLGRWVRDLDVLDLAEAARRLSGQQANLFGIRDRGTLEPGQAADLLLSSEERRGGTECVRTCRYRWSP